MWFVLQQGFCLSLPAGDSAGDDVMMMSLFKGAERAVKPAGFVSGGFTALRMFALHLQSVCHCSCHTRPQIIESSMTCRPPTVRSECVPPPGQQRSPEVDRSGFSGFAHFLKHEELTRPLESRRTLRGKEAATHRYSEGCRASGQII